MKIVVFLGPTLDYDAAKAILPADYQPPAAQGDIYRAVSAGARCIALIDGYFQDRPSVWHKEILWALHKDVSVFGAASMGALRAAELHQCGMIGSGEVYQMYATGKLVSDDAVALVHGPPELGYPKLSVPLVDIQATLQNAVYRSVLTRTIADGLNSAASSLFYAHRTWNNLFDSSYGKTIHPVQKEAFRKWLKNEFHSVKSNDAVELLKRLAKYNDDIAFPEFERPEFTETLLWRKMVAEIENPILRTLR